MNPSSSPDQPVHINRLATEKSPYLIQHAHNPVDWFPWGAEAFEKARRENKPIFLSIGYSTCHWCHVMAHESFENGEIAAVMNKYFVCIKIDREERPDVDAVYMTYVQAATGHGGWPMSVWLTPSLKPFVGGTYYPPPQFKAVLSRIAELWAGEREKILASGETIATQLKQLTDHRVAGTVALDAGLLAAGYQQFEGSYEPVYGGFGHAPKFPRPVALTFLFRYHARTGKPEARDMALYTLRKMAGGGMNDQVGGGFHRYSVDNEWHVPHFEKMLYDQAQLVWAYLDAYQVTGENVYADVAREVLAYVRRDMTGPDGQFYSAEDADSPVPGRPGEHAEGAFYVWEENEIVSILGEKTAAVFNDYYGVEPRGNAPSDPHGEFRNKNILIVRHTVEDTAGEADIPVDETRAMLVTGRKKLFEARNKRPRPHLDDKTLTAWNGLMISAFARAHQVLGDPAYLDAARRAAAFIRQRLYVPGDHSLKRRYRAGDVAVDGFCDDYAFLIQGLIDLYEAGFDTQHLDWAQRLQEKQHALFWDRDNGGYFTASGRDESVLLRIKDDYDGAEPSANSVSVLNLLRLSQFTGNKNHRQWAEQTLAAFSVRIQRIPSAMPHMLTALDEYLHQPAQVVIAGRQDDPGTRSLLRALHGRYLPGKSIMLADGGDGQAYLAGQLPFLKDIKPFDGRATVHVCRDGVCRLPTTDVETMLEQLRSPAS
jgi:hypothetical protein